MNFKLISFFFTIILSLSPKVFFAQIEILKNDTLNLPYWDSTMSHTGQMGYIDTFFVGNNKFRLIHNTGEFDGIVEKFNHSHWEFVTSHDLGNHNDFHRKKDVNGDGFNDLIFQWRWHSDVFLFDNKINNFNDKELTLDDDWIVLDTSKRIFCSESIGKFVAGSSDLYTFQDLEPYYYYRIEYKESENDQSKLDKILLFKCLDGKLENKTKIAELPLPEEDFDESYGYFYWQENYKKLLKL
jgi:hypothetical protein